LRGEVHAAEFLGIAEATGLAVSLSRAVLAGLGEDFAAMVSNIEPDVRISFGPLRQHLLHDDFVADIQRFLETGGVPPARLELRIAEQTFVAMNPVLCSPLRELGVQIVVDEMGRGLGSLDRLARAPIWGLQLDRAWVTALGNDEIALKICRAGIGAARALGLTPIATGVDDAARRDALVALGCFQGTGDLFPDAVGQFDTPIMRRTSHSPPRRMGLLRP
jgi:EAL domain-containing protein (putative c-di-GMP-specific phosphodiesterase class I)